MSQFIQIVGLLLMVFLSLIGIRMLFYYSSFLFRHGKYRLTQPISTEDLRLIDRKSGPVPFIKVQITTRGLEGSTEVITRGIEHLMVLGQEDPAFYGRLLSIEVVTESEIQAKYLKKKFVDGPLSVDMLVLPADYETPNHTALKARALHYTVEKRLEGWNRKPGRTFIVHYDEESVILPDEFRKLMANLTRNEKKILEGPIYYPLEYDEASALCKTMEATRPMACHECQHVMESGIPLHLHGSNLVIEEDFENELGWDMGLLDGQPFIAEDHVFGTMALLKGGSEVFGWHGVVMLEQPPFSVTSARNQRHRWIKGVLQGVTMSRRDEKFRNHHPWWLYKRLMWGIYFRIACFALGAPVGILAFALMPLFAFNALRVFLDGGTLQIPALMLIWFSLIGFMWLASIAIGSWYNLLHVEMSKKQKWIEFCRTLLVSPISGVAESTACVKAVVEWILGKREVNWHPTPKTAQAEASANGKVA